MSTATLPNPVRSVVERRDNGRYIEIDNASWELYELLLRDIGEQHIRINFDNGRLVLVSPLRLHEYIKTLVARMIEIMAAELDIDCLPLGSTTWKRPDLLKGLEADECYYFQNEPAVRFVEDADLLRDPPPDLVLEIDITHQPANREQIYHALGVPEIWKFDGERIEFLARDPNGAYTRIDRSLALPLFTSELVNGYIARFPTTRTTTLVREFQQWVRQQAKL